MLIHTSSCTTAATTTSSFILKSFSSHSIFKAVMMSASRKKEKGKKSRAPPPPPASAAQNPTSPPPGDARIIQMVKTPYTTVNHSYVDYSLVRPDPGETIRPRIEEMDFHQKLHSMLSTSEFSQSINWVWHGRAFRILVPSKFEKTACSEYFGHKRYSSFLYQLGLHGYKKLSAGKDRGAYYSPVRII